MPQISNVVLKDRKTTPVSHTFVPSDIAQPGSVGILVESTGVLLDSNRLTVSMRKTPAGKYKGRMTLSMPVVQNETVNGITRPTVVRTAYATIDVSYDGGSTLAERNDLIGMLADALDPSKVVINDTLVKAESIY